MTLTFSIIRETVPFKGGEIEVRGLGLPDISQLVNANKEVITTLYNKYAGISADDVGDAEMADVLADFVATAPGVVAHAMMLAADLDTSDLSTLSMIPIGAQIEILQKIFELTFATETGLGNLMATLGMAVRGVVAAPKGRRPLMNG